MQFTGLPFETIALIAGVAAALITILYIMKLRKRRVQVPFSPLWGRVLTEYRQQTDWWKRLRRFLSWLIHILMVAGLAFALADPHPEGEVTEGRHIVLLVDSSASMAATDVSGGANRLDLAKQHARKVLETMSAEDRAMLVNFNQQLQPLSPFVGEAALLQKPLENIRVVGTGTAFDQALTFAADSLRDKKRGELVILSDGAGFEKEALERIDFGKNTTVRHLKIGESGGNLAVTAFSVRRYLANKLDFELFVRVESTFDRPIDAELQLHADGRLVDSKPIQLEPRGAVQKFFPSQAVSGERLEARVRLKTQDARDVFPMDDRAFALLPAIKPSKVLLVTRGNLYLEGTLLLNANIELQRVSPEQYDPNTQADVTFFDRDIPEKLPEAGNFIFVAPEEARSPWKINGYVKDPIITSYRKSHPLMRWIAMRDVNIGQAAKFKLERGDQVVASAFGVPMIVARDEGKRKLVGVAFDVRNSDLPLRVAFPVFMINMVDYFQLDDDALLQNHQTGTTWNVTLEDPKATTAELLSPDGAKLEVPVYNRKAAVYGDQIGFYLLKTPNATRKLAANLANPKESNIAPVDLELKDQTITRNTQALFFDRKELWIWAVLIVLGVLVLEWWSYNRRKTV